MKFHALFFSLLILSVSCRQAGSDSGAKDFIQKNGDGSLFKADTIKRIKAVGVDDNNNVVDASTAKYHCWYYLDSAEFPGTYTPEHPISVDAYPLNEESERWEKYNEGGNAIGGYCGALSTQEKQNIVHGLRDGKKSLVNIVAGEKEQKCVNYILRQFRYDSIHINTKLKCPKYTTITF